MKLEEIKAKLPIVMTYQEPVKIKPSKESLKYDRLEVAKKNTKRLLEKLNKL